MEPFQEEILDDPICPICQSENETVMHLLWKCLAANDVWSRMTSPLQKWQVAEDDLLSLWGRMKEKLTGTELELTAATMRALWLRRNESIFENKFRNPMGVIRSSMETLQEYQAANQLLKRGNSTVSGARQGQNWEVPRENYVKTNWDAAVDLRNKKVGFGIIIRDEKGEVLAATCAEGVFSSTSNSRKSSIKEGSRDLYRPEFYKSNIGGRCETDYRCS
ncbi:uncharacterized protein LOC122282483 [Carya illinoinensis]|uniref:uncharacterized protein LOC122282483 n=1 Tax=Carya illinoinensis TaxID=32201 RepID=UPI001C7201B7|nr:uncharacterized protein LOC122282483 [Carya illinoinensis]